MECISGIYKIENLVNGKVYIGQSKNIYERWYCHKNKLNSNKHNNKYLQNAWNKYGNENFDFSILEECSQDEIDDLEIYYIKKYDSANQDKGYNLQLGGKREKVKSSQTLKENLRKAHEYEFRPINKYSFDLEFIERFDCIADAGRSLNKNQTKGKNHDISGIRNAAVSFHYGGEKTGYSKTYKNYLWVFDEDLDRIKDLDFHHYRFGLNSKYPVNQYEYPSGKYICTYKMATHAFKETGISKNSIWFCVEGTQMQSNGYTFRNGNIYPPNQDIYIEPPPVYEPKNVRAVTAYDPKTGEVYKTYSSITKAVEDGFSRHISSCCKGTRKTCGGYAWRYADESNQAS